MSIFEHAEEKELALLQEAERMEGTEQGLEQGLRALVNSLRKFCSDANTAYANVIANREYANLTRKESEKYLRQ